jgi:NitT/TauT family transport system permease protein
MNRKIVSIIVVLIVLGLCWQIVESKANVSRMESGQTGIEAFIPTPLTIFYTFQNQGDIIFVNVLYTIQRALAGFVIGTSFGVAMAIMFLFFPSVRGITFPFAFTMNSFPVVGFAPMIILAFGQGSGISIIFISALICYFPVLINMDSALQSTNRDLLDVTHVLNATPLQELFKLRLPLAMPQLFLSMKLAMPASIIGATIGEWLGTRNGIGQLITIALYQLRPGLLYASLIAVALVSVAFIVLLSLIQSKLLAWNKFE